MIILFRILFLVFAVAFGVVTFHNGRYYDIEDKTSQWDPRNKVASAQQIVWLGKKDFLFRAF